MPEKASPALFLLLSVSCLVLGFLMFIDKRVVNLDTQTTRVLGKSAVQEDIYLAEGYWENFIKAHPRYLPAIIELAQIKKTLGKNNELLTLSKTIEKIDPNNDFLKNP